MILFLDIDGVLNSVESIERARREGRDDDFLLAGARFPGAGLPDPKCVANLNTLLQHLPEDCEIVLISDWRCLYKLEQINALFEYIGIGRNVSWMAPPGPKAKILRSILSEHVRELGYIILDNEELGLECQIQTDERFGLSEGNAHAAIRIAMKSGRGELS
ncbi:HAD domain-containing protein [Desulfocurvibacter africanus]|uniref:HAD domain-containing protein n=1 Tax=Desulfocurvibacter africanus TaxID=873 RepID=UPI000403801F|nr:HAD domain-containing protein [Desulfocurvibacter africanus]